MGGVQVFKTLRKEYDVYVDKPVKDAMWQIKDKDYGIIFKDSGKNLIKTGVVFIREMHNIIDWKI